MKNVLNFLLFIGNVGFVSLILLPFTKLTFNEGFSLSILIAYFHTKSVINKQGLENKIFELKELIESLKK